jgi:hypothetical protein
MDGLAAGPDTQTPLVLPLALPGSAALARLLPLTLSTEPALALTYLQECKN